MDDGGEEGGDEPSGGGSGGRASGRSSGGRAGSGDGAAAKHPLLSSGPAPLSPGVTLSMSSSDKDMH